MLIIFQREIRIIAGMADAVIVVEAASKGGALITAELATKFNRPLLRYPAIFLKKYAQGCHKIIQEGKAHLLESAEEVAELLGWKERLPQQNLCTK